MSFAAVVALIAVWEATRERFTLARGGAGMMRRAWLGLLAVGLTTLVAGFASAPYALYHFNRFAAFGVMANLLAVPITSLWVMPWAILAFPLAFFMARLASKRMRAVLFVMVLLPLWSSYLVRVYAWKLILAKEGIVSWFVHVFGLDFALDKLLSIPGIGGSSLSLSPIGMFIAFCYIWLPYMIVPIQTALERVPKSLLEASGDLGANAAQTFRHVILPLALPGVVAGSIFTFSQYPPSAPSRSSNQSLHPFSWVLQD